MKVMKVGGSCLKTIDDVEKVVKLAKETEKPVLVFSAFYGITDELIKQANGSVTGGFSIDKIRSIHYEMIDMLSPEMKQKAKQTIDNMLSELENIYKGIQLLGELSPSVLDRVQSFGERMVVQVMAAYLNDSGLNARPMSDAEAGFYTEGMHGDSYVRKEQWDIIKEKLSGPEIPVVAGFVGRNVRGDITTLGRGGSDLTATLAGAALGCEVELLKDVDGLMTADPKIVNGAKVVSHINHYDALELAHYGSKVIYKKAIYPAVKAGVPITIRNFREQTEGTRIDSKTSDTIVISTCKNVAIIDVVGLRHMMDSLAKLIDDFAGYYIYPLMLTETSSVGEISIVVETGMLDRVEELIRRNINDKENKINVRKDLALVAVIGTEMKGKVGTAAKIFNTLAKQEANVIAIAQSASERNISVVIDGGEPMKKAAQALHDEFVGQ